MNGEIKRKIDHLRDLLVGKIPVPTDQVKQITLGLIYKFMSDIDEQNRELGGSSFFSGDYQQYAWKHILDHSLSAYDRVVLYSEGLEKMSLNPNLPQLFRDIFKGAFLPFKDPATVDQFLKGLNEFEYQHSEDLGDAYEYLLSIMGSQGDAGQFRTPRHIIDFIVAAVGPHKEDRVLDPACGTAGFLVSAYKYILKENTLSDSDRPGSALSADERKKITENFVGYDISQDMMRISLVNMYLHQFTDPQIYEYDTLTSLDRWDDTFDCILTNPPFMSPSGGIRPHNRFGVHSTRSEVLFVDYLMEHLSPGGRAGVIVPEGIIFQSGNAYKQLRRKLVEEGYLYAVVSLPAGVFQPYSGVKTSILLLDRRLAQKAKAILFVKVEADGFNLGAQRKPIEKNGLPASLIFIKKQKDSIENGHVWDYPINNKSVFLIPKEELLHNSEINFSFERYIKIQELNNKWPLESLENLFLEITNGKNVEQIDAVGKFRVSRIQTISNYEFNIEKTKWTNDDVKEKDFLINGDILLSHINSIDHLAKSAIFTNISEKVVHGINLIRFRPNNTKINPFYAWYVFKSDKFINKARSYAQKAVNQASIKVTDLKNIQIPLPPLEAQHEIVAEIEGYQKIIDGARQVVENWKPSIKIDPDWPRVKLGNVCDRKNRLFNPSKETGQINFIGLENIESKSGNLIGEITKNINEIKSTKNKFRKDEILYGKLRPNLNKVWLAKFEGICSTDIFVLSVNQQFAVPRFVVTYLQCDLFNSQVLSGVSGAQLPRVSYEHFSKLLIPLPPLEIQKRIAMDTVEQQKGVDACKKLIETYEAKIKEKIAEVWGEES